MRVIIRLARSTVFVAGALLATASCAWGQRELSDSTARDSTRSRSDEPARPSRVRGAPQRYDLGVHGDYEYQRPVRLRAIREIPATIAGSLGLAVSSDNLPQWGLVLGSSVALYAADEYLLDKTRMLARHAGLPPNHPSINLRFAGMKLPVPSTIGSGIYFLGDGATDLIVASGFMIHGLVRHDNRAITTASEITTGLVSLGIYTQLLKHAFGRQTPSAATQPRGRWRPFAPLSEYNKNIPAHDAMPSGHLASAMSTVEIVALNYPDKRYIRPLGYTLMTALSFAMVNNGVHWASDYPLALLIGGGVAHATVARGRSVLRHEGATSASTHKLSWSPLIAPSAIGLSLTLPH